MSRLDDLKKQYPELNITLIDLFKKFDPTSTYKYLPLLCKLMGRKFRLNTHFKEGSPNYISEKEKLEKSLYDYGIVKHKLNEKELLFASFFLYYYNSHNMQTLGRFISLMEDKKIEQNDVTKYSEFEDLENAVSLAELKESSKELENQIIREFEDEKWLMLRPLTWDASSKYGSSTKWCTTSKDDKGYFTKYWSRGTLLYVINKMTGYKFAVYKEYYDGDSGHELSFWNSADNRIDSMDLDIDGYLFDKLREILKSKKTNKDFCTPELVNTVYSDTHGLKYESLLLQQQEVDEVPSINFNNEVMEVQFNALRPLSETQIRE